MANIRWLSGVVLQFDGEGRLVLARVANTDTEGVALKEKLQQDNPTHTVVYIQGPAV